MAREKIPGASTEAWECVEAHVLGHSSKPKFDQRGPYHWRRSEMWAARGYRDVL